MGLASGNLLSVMKPIQTTNHGQAMIYGLRCGSWLLVQLSTNIAHQRGLCDRGKRLTLALKPTSEVQFAAAEFDRLLPRKRDLSMLTAKNKVKEWPYHPNPQDKSTTVIVQAEESKLFAVLLSLVSDFDGAVFAR
jgi:hypothetical protein